VVALSSFATRVRAARRLPGRDEIDAHASFCLESTPTAAAHGVRVLVPTFPCAAATTLTTPRLTTLRVPDDARVSRHTGSRTPARINASIAL